MALYAFDGTWNQDQELDDRDTNVRKFFELSDEPADRKLYTEGIGTALALSGVQWAERSARGAQSRKRRVRPLESIWAPGSQSTLSLQPRIRRCPDLSTRSRSGGQGRGPAPPRRFLGLFDTVPAFGLPNVGPVRRSSEHRHDLTLPPSGVHHCFHAIALDERRRAFGATRLDGAHEVWFRGCHSDVGGGNGNTKLSFIALRWMLRKAALCGVPIDEARLTAMALDAGVDPNAPLNLPKDLIRDDFRRCGADDRGHYTVGPIAARADREDCNAFTFTTVETEADEATLAPRL